jgi:hypothetical protein
MHYVLFCALFTIQLCFILIAAKSNNHTAHHPLLDRGKCKAHIWRTDSAASLPGKCHGVNPHTEFNDLKDIAVSNWLDCRALCCNLEERCTTWQFLNSSNTCYIQKRPIRRGPEGTDTLLYCDPYPTHKWNGKYLESRSNGVCKWAYELPRQCFAFGPERLNDNGVVTMQVGKGKRMNTDECERACCNDPECNSWQEYPGRGCYYGQSTCKFEPVEGIYDGGRKCLPGFCGGKESDILLPGQIEKLTKFVQSLKQL